MFNRGHVMIVSRYSKSRRLRGGYGVCEEKGEEREGERESEREV
jgi:hypothetical protein